MHLQLQFCMYYGSKKAGFANDYTSWCYLCTHLGISFILHTTMCTCAAYIVHIDKYKSNNLIHVFAQLEICRPEKLLNLFLSWLWLYFLLDIYTVPWQLMSFLLLFPRILQRKSEWVQQHLKPGKGRRKFCILTSKQTLYPKCLK